VTEATVSSPIVIDSSGWLEYITADTKADLLIPYFKKQVPLLVPTIIIYEVRKILLLRGTRMVADWFVSEIVRHRVLAIDQEIALQAAVLSADHQLHMADALIYAAARDQNAELITTDSHFKDLPGVTIL